MSFRKLIATVAMAGLIAATLVGCGGSDDDELAPATRGPQNVAGQSTCVYIDSPAECKDSGVPEARWFKAPDSEPQRSSSQSDSDHDFLMQMFLFQMMYHTWFSSPMYVERYVVVDHRDSYRNRWSSFDRSYSSRYKTYESKAKYRNTRTGKTVPGSKVNSSYFKKPAPKNNGGDRGKKLCNAFTLDELDKGPGGGSGGGRGGSTSGGSRSGTGGSKAGTKTGVGGDRGKGGTSQHGC